MVLLLIADAAQAELHPRIFAALRPGATLGLSHGFLLGHLDSLGESFPAGIDVVAMCPKGMGASVRALYLQGASVNGAGINASFAVHQDVTGHATDRALGWSVAVGAPFTFQTTLRSEYLSDLTGERSILLGGIHGIVESLYRHFRDTGVSDGDAYLRSVESITGPISRAISKTGLIGLYNGLDPAGRAVFARAYDAAYPVGLELTAEIYDEVSSGNEIRSVVLSGRRFGRFPMSRIERAEMWQVGEKVRETRDDALVPADPYAAGIFCGVMMAQVDIFIEKEHPYTEIANESVIEAVDSLNPYMRARGLSYMVDNCSTTARLGARKWAPRFDYMLVQQAYVSDEGENAAPAGQAPFDRFEGHVIHEVLRVCADLRPPVDIFVGS